jgi:type I restriction enzyme S subunit
VSAMWPQVSLGNLVDFLDSQRRPITGHERKSGDTPYYGANGIQDHVEGFLFDEPLVLLAEDGGHFDDPSRGIAYGISGKSWVNNHAHVLRPKPNTDFRFLVRALENRDVRPFLTGSTRAKLTKAGASRIEIALPPIEVQIRIAAILDKADEVRVKRRMAVAVFDTLPLALFDEMFGDPATNPKGWERTLLGDLLSGIESGSSPVCLSRPAEPGEWGVLKLGAVTKCIFDDTENKALPPDVPPSKQHEVKVGDLLFSRKNTRLLVGASALVTSTQQRLLLSDLIFRLKIKPQAPLVAIYLHQLLIHPSKRTQIQKLAGGTAGSMPNISKARLMGSSVEVPPVELQEAFAEKVSSTMDLTSVAKASIPHIDDLFASIQQRAFQGSL